MKSSIKILLVIVITAALIFGITVVLNGNVEKQNAQAKEAQIKPLISVQIAPIQTKKVQGFLKATGIFKAFETLEVLSETDGKIVQIYFDLNTRVVQGQVLAIVDAKTKQTQRKIAEINYQKAKRDFERYEALFKNNNLSEYDLENARFQMQNAEQNLQLSQQALDYAVIKSPISGVISQKLVGMGKVLGVGVPLATITDIAQLRLFVNLTAQDLDKVKVGQKVQVVIPTRKEEKFEGIIKSIAVQSTDAGTFPVEILMQNNPTKPILAGMNAEVILADNTQKEILLVPRIAILDNQVFVIEDEKAVSKKVVLGKEYGENIEVLSGLKLGEKVIIKGQNNVENGQKVKIQ
ncbi:MAG: efflux RND transporter periplasmic adaptor subunit [Raineya sp.]|jgi:RND family efflux transporter MFP subunit|nr:efflux RND transporter periplasmic adaptor subunit [Raineya sp.]